MLAFGGVADGFVPFDGPTGSLNSSSSSNNRDGDKNEVKLELASIVMKAVQVPSPHALTEEANSNLVSLLVTLVSRSQSHCMAYSAGYLCRLLYVYISINLRC